MAEETEEKDVKQAPARSAGRPWVGIAAVVVLILLLGGMFVAGMHRARVTNAGVGFERGFAAGDRFGGGPGMGGHMRGGMQGGRFADQPQGDRLVGGVAAITGNTLTVRSNGSSTTVTVSNSTSFYEQGTVGKQSDLQVGDVVMIVGAPDSSGNVAATAVYIR